MDHTHVVNLTTPELEAELAQIKSSSAVSFSLRMGAGLSDEERRAARSSSMKASRRAHDIRNELARRA